MLPRLVALTVTFVSLALCATGVTAQQPEAGLKAPEPIAAVPVQILNKDTKLQVRGVAFSPDGKTLYTAGTIEPTVGPFDGRLWAWDVASGKLVREHKGPRMGFFSDGLFDGKYLLGRSETERHLILVDPTSGEEVRRTQENTTRFDRYYPLPDRKRILAVNGAGPRTGHEPVWAWEWDLVTGKRGAEIPLDLSGGFSEAGVVCSPDGAWFAQSGGGGVGLRVLDAKSGKRVLFDLIGHRPTFAPDGKAFAYVVGDESRVRLYQADAWSMLAELPWPGDPPPDAPGSRGVRALHFSADGRALVIAYNDYRIAVVEVATGQIRYRFEHHTSSLWVFPENPLLVTVARPRGDFTPGDPVPPSGWVSLWDLHNPTGRRESELTKTDAIRCIKQLDDIRAVVASEGMRALAANPPLAIGLLRQSLHAAPKPDANQVARWIADLDADDFDTREKAEHRLREYDAAIRTQLESAQVKPRSNDAAMRLRALWDGLNDPARPARLRVLRSVELFEYFATQEARAALETLADGAPGAVSTEEAKASLRRLQRRQP